MEQKKDNDNMSRNGQGDQRQQIRNTDYLLRKAEKLTTALYLVSDIMSEKEPMKWRLREAGVDLLSDVAIAATVPGSERMSILRNVMKRVDRVVSFLDITLAAHMLSEMNITVLKREYLAFKDAVEAEWNRVHQSGKAILGDGFFNVSMTAPAIESSKEKESIPRNEPPSAPLRNGELPLASHQHHSQINQSQNNQSKAMRRDETSVAPERDASERQRLASLSETVSAAGAHTQNMPPQPVRVNPPAQPRPQFIQHDQFSRTAHAAERGAAPFPGNNNADSGRSDRRKIILALAKQKPSINVGDVARSIPGVSEKTIQRELLAMVAEGILEKRGERRWSTYSLRT